MLRENGVDPGTMTEASSAGEPVGLDDVAEMWDANAAEWDACLGVDGDDTRRYWSDDVVLSMLGSPAGCQILDLGCGPGRDLKAFTGLGHVAVGLEGSERFAAMAREHSGCEVWKQDLLALELPEARFDGHASSDLAGSIRNWVRFSTRH